MSAWEDEISTLIEDCENRSHKLDDWELSFVDSLKHQITKGQRPSQKQEDRLNEIWEKVTK